MSGSADKKIIANNKSIFKNLIYCELVSLLPVLILYFQSIYSHQSLFYLSLELLAIFFLYKLSRTKRVDSRVVPCANLCDKGVVGLLFDLIYLCWLGKITVIFYKWSTFVIMIVFGICIYYEIVGRHRKR